MYQVLRSSGIRISDLVRLRPDDIQRGFLQGHRGHRPKLPPVAVAALAAIQPGPAGYYFWTGDGFKGACDSVWRTFARFGRRAGLAGVPIPTGCATPSPSPSCPPAPTCA